jgi:hypothetical protein
VLPEWLTTKPGPGRSANLKKTIAGDTGFDQYGDLRRFAGAGADVGGWRPWRRLPTPQRILSARMQGAAGVSQTH